MKNLALVTTLTVITLVLWLVINLQLSKYSLDNKIVLDSSVPVSGTIDMEFLKEISNNSTAL